MRLFSRPGTTVLCASLVSAACSPANKNDPGFWTQSNDPGATQFTFGQPGGGTQNAGGSSSTGGFIGSGGTTQGMGGVVGSGGTQSVGGTSSGSGGTIGSGGLPPTGGVVGTGGVTGTGGATGTACTVTFTITTGPGTGTYAPKNVTAMWIADSAGTLVKTLEVYASIRMINLLKWEAASGGTIPPDAVTGATLPNHIQHIGTWNCKDGNGNIVPDGQYQAFMEWVDYDAWPFGTTNVFSVPFPKGSGPQNLTPANQTGFSQITLNLQ